MAARAQSGIAFVRSATPDRPASVPPGRAAAGRAACPGLLLRGVDLPPPTGRSRPVLLPLLRGWMGVSLAAHVVFATALGLWTWSSGPLQQGAEPVMRVNLILAPDAAGAGANAGQSGSHPASVAPAAVPAPVPPSPPPAQEAPPAAAQTPPPPPEPKPLQGAELVPLETNFSPSTVSPAQAAVSESPVRDSVMPAPIGALAETVLAASAKPPTAPLSGDSERIPAAWSMDTASVPSGGMVFQARFREPPLPPSYPPESVARNEEGTVWFDLYLSETGGIVELRIARSSGYPRLDRAAAAAVSRWRFLPSRRLGRAVASWVRVPVHFQLR